MPKTIMQHKNLFQFTQDIYHRLSREDQLKISPSGRFIDSPNLISRIIDFSPHHQVTGFAEAYKFNGTSNNVAFIVIAILPEWRGQNIGTSLLEQIENDIFNKGYNRLMYRTSINNKASIGLAKKNNYKQLNKSKNFITFIKDK